MFPRSVDIYSYKATAVLVYGYDTTPIRQTPQKYRGACAVVHALHFPPWPHRRLSCRLSHSSAPRRPLDNQPHPLHLPRTCGTLHPPGLPHSDRPPPAAVAASWIFVILLAALLLANERFVRFYMRFAFQVGIFFTTLFSFLIFFLPVIFHRIGPYMFFASGVA